MTSVNNQHHRNLVGTTIASGRLELVSVLGLGAYGVVYLARDLHHPLQQGPFPTSTSSHRNPEAAALLASGKGGAATGFYAVKCLNRTGLDARQKAFQRREIALHTMACKHPGIVSLYQVLDDTHCIYVVMDYCPDGDLFSMITENQRYSVPVPRHGKFVDSHGKTQHADQDPAFLAARGSMDTLIKSVFDQIVDAVEYCHHLGIYHRDLKPENILCLEGGARVVLADFGLATADKMSSDFGCGSTFYMGPECQGGITTRLRQYSTAANDVWSLGVILVNLVCGRNPWKQACPGDETFCEYLRNPDFLKEILPISDALNNVLKRVFAPFAEKRCSISELRQLVRDIPRFTATTAELKQRQEAAKLAAAKAQAARVALANQQAQAAQAHIPPAHYKAHASTAAAIHQQLQPASPPPLPSQPKLAPLPAPLPEQLLQAQQQQQQQHAVSSSPPRRSAKQSGRCTDADYRAGRIAQWEAAGERARAEIQDKSRRSTPSSPVRDDARSSPIDTEVHGQSAIRSYMEDDTDSEGGSDEHDDEETWSSSEMDYASTASHGDMDDEPITPVSPSATVPQAGWLKQSPNQPSHDRRCVAPRDNLPPLVSPPSPIHQRYQAHGQASGLPRTPHKQYTSSPSSAASAARRHNGGPFSSTSDEEMLTPSSGSSRGSSRSDESRRSSASYTGLPPTPRFHPHPPTVEIRGNLEAAADDAIKVAAAAREATVESDSAFVEGLGISHTPQLIQQAKMMHIDAGGLDTPVGRASPIEIRGATGFAARDNEASCYATSPSQGCTFAFEECTISGDKHLSTEDMEYNKQNQNGAAQHPISASSRLATLQARRGKIASQFNISKLSFHADAFLHSRRSGRLAHEAP